MEYKTIKLEYHQGQAIIGCLQIELLLFLGKSFILYYLLFSPVGLYGQNSAGEFLQNDSLIYWNAEKNLSWSDFQGKPDGTLTTYGGDSAMAITSAPLECLFDMDEGQVVFEIHCYFLKKNSWVRDASKQLLEHEQLHFDIAELFARKMNKSLQILQQKGISVYEPYVKMANEIISKRAEFEKEYDRETFHGAIDFMQEKWNKKVKQELEELGEYKIDYSEYLNED